MPNRKVEGLPIGTTLQSGLFAAAGQREKDAIDLSREATNELMKFLMLRTEPCILRRNCTKRKWVTLLIGRGMFLYLWGRGVHWEALKTRLAALESHVDESDVVSLHLVAAVRHLTGACWHNTVEICWNHKTMLTSWWFLAGRVNRTMATMVGSPSRDALWCEFESNHTCDNQEHSKWSQCICSRFNSICSCFAKSQVHFWNNSHPDIKPQIHLVSAAKSLSYKVGHVGPKTSSKWSDMEPL